MKISIEDNRDSRRTPQKGPRKKQPRSRDRKSGKTSTTPGTKVVHKGRGQRGGSTEHPEKIADCNRAVRCTHIRGRQSGESANSHNLLGVSITKTDQRILERAGGAGSKKGGRECLRKSEHSHKVTTEPGSFRKNQKRDRPMLKTSDSKQRYSKQRVTWEKSLDPSKQQTNQ